MRAGSGDGGTQGVGAGYGGQGLVEKATDGQFMRLDGPHGAGVPAIDPGHHLAQAGAVQGGEVGSDFGEKAEDRMLGHS
jgi:hypothetical protein